jgi:membrane protease YdiL (CAAX protease family)
VRREARQALVAGGLVLGYGAVAGRAPEGARLPANLAAAAGLVALARRWGRSWADLGLHPADLPAGIAVGVATVPVIATALGATAAVPPARDLFSDERVLGMSGWEAWREVLVRVPLETALAEEVLFRGGLLGLARAAGDDDRVAVAAVALAFGVWHVLPALESHRSNPAAADVADHVGGAGAVVASTIVATAAAGVAFAWLRLRSRSVVAPVIAHAALNSLAFVATHWIDRRRASRSAGPAA